MKDQGFENTYTNYYDSAGQPKLYQLIGFDAKTTSNPDTGNITVDLHEVPITFYSPYTDQSFSLTHKGYTWNISNLPKTTTGLVSGDLYVDSNGFVKIMF